MRTAHSLPYGGLPGQRPPLDRDLLDREPPWREIPWTETPLDRDPLDQEPPWREIPWTETPWTETPLERDPLDRDPPLNRITDRCKNISFPLLRLLVVKSTHELRALLTDLFLFLWDKCRGVYLKIVAGGKKSISRLQFVLQGLWSSWVISVVDQNGMFSMALNRN